MVPINSGYDYHPINNIETARKLLKECQEFKRVSYDIETTGLFHVPETIIRTIAFCTGYPNRRYVHIVGDYRTIIEEVVVDDSEDAFIKDKKERDYITKFLLKYILNNEEIAKIGWNLKFDNSHVERVLGYPVKGKVLDGFLMKKLINPADKGAGLKNTTIEMLDESYHNYEDDVLKHLNGKRKNKDSVGDLFRTIPAIELCGYNAIDTEAALILTDALYSTLKRFPGLENLYHKIVDPLSQVLTSVELQGMCVDKELVMEHILSLQIDAKEAENKILDNPAVKAFTKTRTDAIRSAFEEEHQTKIIEALNNWRVARRELHSVFKDTRNKDVPSLIRKGIDDYLETATKASLKTWSAKTGDAIAKKVFGKDIEHHYECLQHKINRKPISKAVLKTWSEDTELQNKWSSYTTFLKDNYAERVSRESFQTFYSSGIIATAFIRSVGESYLKEVYDSASKKISQLFNKRRKLIEPLNIGSPSQLKALIYTPEGLNMDAIIKGTDFEGESTTNAGLLKRLPFEQTTFPEFVEQLLIMRGIDKAISTYLKVLYDNSVLHEDGTHRIHGTFRIGGTETGRLSSANPNLQNIPRAGSKTGTAIKSCIIAPEGYKMMQIDFSQMELRMLALASFDKHMLNIYASGEDLHKFAAMSILGVDAEGWEKIDKSEKKKARTMAKAVNFGYMYGMGPNKFKLYAETSYGIKFSEKEAKQLQTKFFTAFPSIVRYYTQMKQMVYEYIEEYKTIPYVFNMFGRMRPLLNCSYDMYNKLKQDDKNSYVASASRNAINTVIQSSCADLMMLFLIQFNERVSKFNKLVENDKAVQIINTVHDSIILYVKDEYIEHIYSLAKSLIQNPTWMEDFGIPFDRDIIFEVDFEIGSNWANLKEFEYNPLNI